LKDFEVQIMKKLLRVFRARFIVSFKMYIRYPINILATFIDPLIWLTPYYFLGKTFTSDGGTMTGFAKYTGNSDFMGFLIIGWMITSYVTTVFWTMGFSLKEEMRQGVLESNWSAPVSRVFLLISKSTFQFAAATFEIIMTGVICHFVFGFNINSGILKAIAFLIPGIIGMMGLGLMIASLVLLAKEANGIIDISSALVQGFSGGYFPVRVMPNGLIYISLVLPLTYVYDSIRNILINQIPLMPISMEFVIILISMAGFCLLGSFVFNRVEKRCRMLGILGTH
jgi:ABC-2 type transport system permease protein